MKLSKFVKRAKSESYCVVIHADDSGIWLGTRLALYNATELPYMEGKEQAGAVLDIDSKAWEKMFFDEKYTAHAGADFGMNLTEPDGAGGAAGAAGNVLQGYGAGWPCVRQWWGADLLRRGADCTDCRCGQDQRLHTDRCAQDCWRCAVCGYQRRV